MFRGHRASIFAAVGVFAAYGGLTNSANASGKDVDTFYGTYQHTLAIQTPQYHGITPKLALNYSSNESNGFVGVGWSLSGASTIERMAPKFGVPTYTSTDIYVLDGQELIPCSSGISSPSCSTGGTHATKVEGYARIKFESSGNKWIITQKDGTTAEYTSLAVAGASGTYRWGIKTVKDLSTNAVTYNWYCESSGSTCTSLPAGCDPSCYGGETCESYGGGGMDPYMYKEAAKKAQSFGDMKAFDGVEKTGPKSIALVAPDSCDPYYEICDICYPCTSCTSTSCAANVQSCYLDTVTYNSVTVKFYRESRTDKFSHAEGPRMGDMNYRLKAVTVKRGSNQIRAYALNYTSQGNDTRSKLASVKGYGKNYVINSSGVISSGTTAPTQSFTWESRLAGWTNGTSSANYDSSTSPTALYIFKNHDNRNGFGNIDGDNNDSVRFADVNGDGRADPCIRSDGGIACYLATATGFAYSYGYNSAANGLGIFKNGFSMQGYGTFDGDNRNSISYPDVNGDGKADVCGRMDYGIQCYLSKADGTGWEYSSGYNTRTTGQYIFNRYSSQYGCGSFDGDNHDTVQYPDVNGDGKDDTCIRMDYGVQCYLSTGTGFAYAEGYDSRRYRVCSGSVSYASTPSRAIYYNNGNDTDGDNRPTLTYPDLNGDGMADACMRHDSGLKCYLSTGSGWKYVSGYQTTKFKNGYYQNGIGSFDGNNNTTIRFGDLNGDGNADVCIRLDSGVECHLSTGSGFVTEYGYNTYSTGQRVYSDASGAGGGDNHPYFYVQDVNGDGNADICMRIDAGMDCWASTGLGFKHDYEYYPGGGGYVTMQNGYYQKGYGTFDGDNHNSLAFADVSGDGRPDLCVRMDYGIHCFSNKATHALIKTVYNGVGGSASITYAPSSQWVNTNNPGIMMTVTQMVGNDGRGGTTTTKFSYAGGLYDREERRFLGFHYAKEIEPCTYGSSQCPYNETWYKQDYGSVSKPETIKSYTGTGKLLSQSSYSYLTNGSSLPYTSVESSRWAYVYDGSGGTCSSWPCAYGKRSYLSLGYDTYANQTYQISYGNYDVSGDERRTQTTYYPNTTAYVVGLPGRVTTYFSTSTSSTYKNTDTLFYYDNNGSYASVPLTGKLTKERAWLNTTGAWVDSKMAYDTWGNMTSTTDALGKTTTAVYDSTYHQFKTSKTDKLGRASTIQWDYACGLATQVTTPDGRTVSTTLDALCRPLTNTTAGGSVTSYGYVGVGSPSSQYTEVRGPGPGGTTVFSREYSDGLGRVYKSVKSGPNADTTIVNETEYDARGNERRASAASYAYTSSGTTSQWVTTTFDDLDRPTRVTKPDGTYQTMSYGLMQKTATDEMGRWMTEYTDGHGQIIERREKLGSGYVRTTYAYDGRGKPVRIVDDAGNVWSFTFDSLGRRIQIVDPDAGTWNYEYDALGRETKQIAVRPGASYETWSTYDATNRITKRERRVGGTVSETITMTYDQVRSGYHNIGKITTMTDPSGTQTIDYDLAGNAVRSTRTIDGVSYTTTKGYDSGDRLLWTTFPDGDNVGTPSSPLTYDQAGRITSVPGYVTAASYDAMGRLTSRTNSNGTVTTRTYDNTKGWMTGIRTMKGSTTLQSLTYTRNNSGQITQLSSMVSGEGWNYAYDDLKRLTSATNHSSSANNQTFAYNAIGNMTSNSRVGTYGYPGAGSARPHAVSSAGGNSYAYDANGNMTSGAGRTISWDLAGRPTSVNGATFAYDGSGVRIKKVENGVTTISLGSNYQVINGTVTKYVELAGELVAKKVGSTKYWLHSDHLGSVQSVTNSSGGIVLRSTYRPYGDRMSNSSSHKQTRSYTGQVQDDSGLMFMNARYYDPVLGRFISADPTMPSGDSSVGLNRYAYAANDPVNHHDTDGLGLFSFVGKIFKAIGKVFKAVGKFLLKIAPFLAKLPVFGGIFSMVANFLGNLFMGNIGAALQWGAVLAIMIGSMFLSAGANTLINGVIANKLMAYMVRAVAQAVIGGIASFSTAMVMGAPAKQAFSQGLKGAAIGFAMETFSTFIDMVPGIKDAKMGTKSDVNAAGQAVEHRIANPKGFSKLMQSAREGFNKLMGEDAYFNTKILGRGSMRGLQKVFSFIHDEVMAVSSKLFGTGNWYPGGGTGSTFNFEAGSSAALFIVEWPLNFGTIKLLEMGFQLAGEKLESRAAAGGHDLLGYMFNTTLNPGIQMERDIMFGMGMWRFE